MAKGKDVHVVPVGNKWGVEATGGPVTSTHNTQQAAIDVARQQARRNESELVIHNQQGQIRDKDSHGHDPNPPKG
jgi:hypothetical protein